MPQDSCIYLYKIVDKTDYLDLDCYAFNAN